MWKSAKSKAEEQFTASQKKYQKAQTEQEEARRERAELVANLRALRLAKEAEDKKAAEKVVPKNITAKNRVPLRSPQGH